MYRISILLFFGFVLFSSSMEDEIDRKYCNEVLCKQSPGAPHIWHSGCPENKSILGTNEFLADCDGKNPEIIKLNEDDKKLILELHNTQRNFVACGGLRPYGLRSGCRIGAMEWDDELAETASFHVRRCTFAHDKCRNTINYPFSGQNIGMSTTGRNLKPLQDLIKNFSIEWFKEYCFVSQDVIDKVSHNTNKMTGHFLALLNERNSRVGCAAVKFSSTIKGIDKKHLMLTCNYPITSINGVTLYNSCKNPGNYCVKKHETFSHLCSTHEKYDCKSPFLNFILYDGNDKEELGKCGEPPEGKDGVTCIKKVVGGGGSEVGGTEANEESNGGDNGITDSGGAHGGAADSAGGDSGGADGGAADSSGADSGGADSGGGDSGGDDIDDLDYEEYFDYEMGPYPDFANVLCREIMNLSVMFLFVIIFRY